MKISLVTKGLFLSYFIILAGQLISFFITILFLQTEKFNFLSIENFAKFDKITVAGFFYPYFIWYIGTGFIFFILIAPIICAIFKKMSKLLLVPLIGPQVIFFGYAIEQNLLQFFLIALNLLPAFASLLIAVTMQSRLMQNMRRA